MYVGGKYAYHASKDNYTTSDKSKGQMQKEIEQETKRALANLVIDKSNSIINHNKMHKRAPVYY